ncbi:MAG: DNA repair protein RecN [Alphaproteobacteria bacterium]|nr:DNA repair protein RecN [Alphaproteobacteria bacterium]
MLAHLSIRDIVLIDKLDIELGAGLSVLTGETGAGKSILLDAFALALGARGDGSLVRQGAAQGQVTAAFDLPAQHPALDAARASGADTADGLILRRAQLADGRTRAYINDQPVSVQALRAVGGALVEIHGQHDDRALVEPAAHRALLDAFGGLEKQAQGVRNMQGAWREARDELQAGQARIEAARREADYLRHAHEELSKLAAQENEESELAARRTSMQQAEKVVSEIREAHDALASDHAPGPVIAALLRRLERRAPQAPQLIEPSLKALGDALNAFDIAAQTLHQALRDCNLDPNELETTEERLFAIRAAARKYNVAPDALAALAHKFASDLDALDKGEADLGRLEARVAKLDGQWREAAAKLSAARRKCAQQLDGAVQKELPPLKLENAKFITQIDSDPQVASADGWDRIEFWVQTNPGTRPGPMMKVASGGELARFMLALKVSLADRGSAPTLVFDEIDTGVGGAVADAIGARLARLAGKVQVLAVTHAPQVAARSASHMKIAKVASGKSKRVATTVEVLPSDARREEIARMLAGATVTDEARAAAARLLNAD